MFTEHVKIQLKHAMLSPNDSRKCTARGCRQQATRSGTCQGKAFLRCEKHFKGLVRQEKNKQAEVDAFNAYADERQAQIDLYGADRIGKYFTEEEVGKTEAARLATFNKYAMGRVSNLDKQVQCGHCEKKFKIRDFKVEIGDTHNYICCTCGASMLEWFTFKV